MKLIDNYKIQPILLKLFTRYFPIILIIVLSGCDAKRIKPIFTLDSYFNTSLLDYQTPKLLQNYLISIINFENNSRIQLIDIKRKKIIPLPAINTFNYQPINVSASLNAKKIVFIGKGSKDYKLFIYYRNSGFIRELSITPKGVPIRASISSSGEIVAIEVIRNELRGIDIIQLNR